MFNIENSNFTTMKKIILWIFLFCLLWIQYVSADLSNAVFNFWPNNQNTLTIWDNWSISVQYIRTWTLFNAIWNFPNTQAILSWVCWVMETTSPHRIWCYFSTLHTNWTIQNYQVSDHVSPNWTLNIAIMGTQTDFYPVLYYVPSLWRDCIMWKSWTSFFCSYIAGSNLRTQNTTAPKTLIWPASGSFISLLSTQSSWPILECSDITTSESVFTSLVNSLWIIDISDPQNWSFFKTSSNGFFGVLQWNNITDIEDMLSWSWSASFKTSLPFNPLWEATYLYFGWNNWLRKIDLTQSNIWEVTLRRFSTSWNLLETKNVNTNTIIEFLQTSYVTLEVPRSFWVYTIDWLDFFEWSIEEVESELCYNPENEEYTLDWDIFEGDINSIETPLAPGPTEYSFTVWGYNFFENGFCLSNFIPDPYGGNLVFEIINPIWEQLESKKFTWSDYGFDTCPKVTTFLHELAWNYRVRVRYEYIGNIVYPFWQTYNNYEITLPEELSVFDWLEYENCNSDTSAFSWVINFFSCSTSFITSVFSAIPTFLTWIYEFLSSFLEIWNVTEFKTWGFFFPQAYASNTQIVDWLLNWDSQISSAFTNSSWYGFIDNILLFLKAAFVFIVFILILSLYFTHNSDKWKQ